MSTSSHAARGNRSRNTSRKSVFTKLNETTAREGHFYAGAAAEEEAAADSDWAFAPVAFEHTRLDGAASVRENADAIIAEIQAAEMSQSTS